MNSYEMGLMEYYAQMYVVQGYCCFCKEYVCNQQKEYWREVVKDLKGRDWVYECF